MEGQEIFGLFEPVVLQSRKEALAPLLVLHLHQNLVHAKRVEMIKELQSLAEGQFFEDILPQTVRQVYDDHAPLVERKRAELRQPSFRPVGDVPDRRFQIELRSVPLYSLVHYL